MAVTNKNMTKIHVGLFNIVILCASFLFATSSFATDRSSPTFSITVDGGPVTYKSKFVASNDTSTYLGYNLAIRGGMNKNIEVAINTSTINTAFELNSSAVNQLHQDTTIRYYLGPIYFGLVLNQTELVTTVSSTETSDSLSKGMGGNFGLALEIGRGNYFFFDASSITTSLIKEIKQTDLAIGARTDINIGGIVRITKSLLDARIGYKLSSYALTLSGTTSQESLTTTWVGLGLNFYF